MTYRFYASSTGGQFGWLRWRNTIPSSVLPAWMSVKGDDLWGCISMGDPPGEREMQELVSISEELGLYTQQSEDL